ncbi:MAG TPA: class I SAM-dependent methyltransferase [Leptospiraceae bacterium]|nr:class I SAM-dependent methyltransferase [Leptospiraceae bacterium]
MTQTNNDKAGEEYWSTFWKNYTLPDQVILNPATKHNYAFREIHKFYSSHLPVHQNTNLIEIGCGNSVFLSYFNTYFKYQVSGLDYSEYGCLQTKKILERDQISGNIYQGDLFSPPADLTNKFDIVCSFGVVEHFDNTSDVIQHIAAFAKPGGIIITTIPNLTGVTGWLQKWMNKPVYDIHKVMGLSDIEAFIKNAGLSIIASTRIIPVSFGVTLDEYENKSVKYKSLKKIILKGFQVIEKILCFIDDRLFKLPRTEAFCAGMIVIARKPQ